ncbi:two-component system sensor histidine kinase RegB [Litorivivens lipolytica]|uniref:histidine kinase n=1 Tax=Litorivivens lipolytica TaxID=1524264 RepID=A0A7W4Z4A3_9GAMM|nr:ATP-binding protein [Litorivivens lipolytica]MBB3046339.1 two-component system sensor histidine kinase RegB [Litorivivens lipolytica]
MLRAITRLRSYNTKQHSDDTLSKQMRQLVQLRWMAVLGQLLTILVAHYSFGVSLPLGQMFGVLAGLVVFNGLYEISLRVGRPIHTAELFVGLLVDITTLTFQLYLSGGATNPFVFLYVLQVGLAAVLMAAPLAWALLGVATLCFLWLAEKAKPLDLPLDYHLGFESFYVQGMFICLLLNAALLVIFVNRITQTHRERDARLAELRQRAAEEEHILRMGLLASGAAHELGTPLATIAVLLGDWRHMPELKDNPDLNQDIEEMQAQVRRCKSIVSGILMSAGETRGEASGETTVNEFFDELIAEWLDTRKSQELHFENRFGEDVDIASDSVLKQTICNLLDNALEASPLWVGMEVSRDADDLIIRVFDRGPGFDGEVFKHLGQPYQSTKGRPGSGLGLFLVFNVVRTLGGEVQTKNLPGEGAEVILRLPLESLVLKED